MKTYKKPLNLSVSCPLLDVLIGTYVTPRDDFGPLPPRGKKKPKENAPQ